MAFDLKTKLWQTGALDWWGMIDGEDVFLGNREFPVPPQEGDEWHVRATGDLFRVIDAEVCKVGNKPFEEPPWV